MHSPRYKRAFVFILTFSYKWTVPFTYTTDLNLQWTNPHFVWMQKSDGKLKHFVDFIIVKLYLHL